MIRELSIKHFKSIESADITLDNVTVFVGNNGTGKSNIVDALRFLKEAILNGVDRAFSDRHGVESVRQWSPTRPYRISLHITMDEPAFLANYQVSIDSAKGNYQIHHEDVEIVERITGRYHNEETDEIEVYPELRRLVSRRERDGSVKRTTWAARLESDVALNLSDPFLWIGNKPQEVSTKVEAVDELILTQRTSWEYASLRRRLADFQAYSIYPNTLRIPQEPSNEIFLAPEGRNLASVFKRMRRIRAGAGAIAQITDAMKFILPNIEQISILSVGGFLVPQFHMCEPDGKRHKFNVAQMSDGTLRVLGLLTALYQEPRPAVIALEEPEQTVNPGVLAVLAESIKEVSRKTQVIITTHSPHLLDQFLPEQVRAVHLDAGHSQVNMINKTQVGVVRDRLFTLGELLVSEGLHGD